MSKFEFNERVKLYLKHYAVIHMIRDVEKDILPYETERLVEHIRKEVKTQSWFDKRLFRDGVDGDGFLCFWKISWLANEDDGIKFYLGKDNFETDFISAPFYVGIYVPGRWVKTISVKLIEHLSKEAEARDYTIRSNDKADSWPIFKYVKYSAGQTDSRPFIVEIMQELRWLFSLSTVIDNIKRNK